MVNLDPIHSIAVFTDGSAYHKDRSGGWAWVAIDAFEGEVSASGHCSDTTISQMELYAPTQALDALYAAFGAIDVLVYSDSEYVVKGSNDRTRKRNTNLEWWSALDDAIDQHEYVELAHVKGHADNHYNEIADQLAGAARKKGRE